MEPEELAAKLNGREYGSEITDDEARQAKQSGLVVAFGASDDLVEFRGAIYDEIEAYDGAVFRVTTSGLMSDWDTVDHEDEDECERYFQQKHEPSSKVNAVWGADGYSWIFLTTLPHATFDIFEDGDAFCRGIVFRLADAGKESGAARAALEETDA